MAKYESLTFETEIDKRMAEIAHFKPSLLIGFGQFCESNDIMAKVTDVDEKRRVMAISSLRNKADETISPANNHLHIVTSVNGLTYRFASKLRHASWCNGQYEFDFPQIFEYLQRRAYYRVPLERGDADVSFDIGGVTPVMGELQDISVSGMRVKTTTAVKPGLDTGALLSKCRLSINGYNDIRFTANVRYTEELANEHYVLGFSIQDIENADQNIIERFVAMRDMQIRRQQVGWR